MKKYETDRLILRIIDETYAKQVTEYYNRNREFLEEWEMERSPEFFTEEFQKNSLKNEYQQIKEGQRLQLWISKKEDTELERIIGCASFGLIIRGILQSCIMGYKLDKGELNKGYMTEALQKGISIIFEEYKLHRIESPIMPKNVASIATIQKLGFENEGLAKKYMFVNGKWEDHFRFSLVNPNN